MSITFAIIFVGFIAILTGIAVGFFIFRPRQKPISENSPSDDVEKQLLAMEERLRDRFKAVAAEALQSNQEILFNQAKLVVENAKNISSNEMQKQTLEFQKTLSPLQNSLQKLETEIKTLEQSRVAAYAGLTEQVRELAGTQKELKTQAGNLVQALRAPQARGAWGELQLKRAVEFAGMVNYVDFQEQVSTLSSDDTRQRPDMTIKMPSGRTVVVDAKVPLYAYLSALEAVTPEDKKRFLVDHARQLKDHYKKLGAKKYFEQFTPSPEFVVLFLHTESLLSAALEQDPQLIEDAIKERVLIATPTTLIALLKTVAYGWGEVKAAEKAREIVALGQELIERFATVAEYWQSVGVSLNKAVESYNKASVSTQSRLLPTVRKLEDKRMVEDFKTIDSRPTETISLKS